MSDYDVPSLPLTKPPANGIRDFNPHVPDIVGAFDQMREVGDHLSAWDGSLIPGVRYTKANLRGGNRSFNHFQGIQRLRRGNYAVVSGADKTAPASHIFVVRMDSRPAGGPWGTNLLKKREPPPSDTIVRPIAVEKKRWHGGGIHVLGDILAVPIYGEEGGAKIVFLHMADPENPTRFPPGIDIFCASNKAGAVALEKVRDRYVCAVWYEVKKTKNMKFSGRIDFYVSESDNFFDGFPRAGVPAGPRSARQIKTKRAAKWCFGDGLSNEKRDPAYQAISLIIGNEGEPLSNGRYRLYLIGTENTSGGAPIFGGKDQADLFSVELTDDFLDGVDNAPAPVVRRERATKSFQLYHEHGNFDGGAGVHIDPSGILNMYSAYHWRADGTLLLTEFRSEPDPRPMVITDPRDAWVDLFEHDGFNGRRLSILGTNGSALPDYGRLFVQGSGFEDKVSSVRYQIPDGFAYRLYKHDRYEGRAFDLEGNGTVRWNSNLKHKSFGDCVSSSRYVRRHGSGWRVVQV